MQPDTMEENLPNSQKLQSADTEAQLTETPIPIRDYTKERHQWLDGVTLDELVAEIYARREPGENS